MTLEGRRGFSFLLTRAELLRKPLLPLCQPGPRVAGVYNPRRSTGFIVDYRCTFPAQNLVPRKKTLRDFPTSGLDALRHALAFMQKQLKRLTKQVKLLQ